MAEITPERLGEIEAKSTERAFRRDEVILGLCSALREAWKERDAARADAQTLFRVLSKHDPDLASELTDGNYDD